MEVRNRVLEEENRHLKRNNQVSTNETIPVKLLAWKGHTIRWDYFKGNLALTGRRQRRIVCE